MRKLLRLICCLASICVAACSRIDAPQADDGLVVAVLAAPAFFQIEGATPSGFEHDLGIHFYPPPHGSRTARGWPCRLTTWTWATSAARPSVKPR